MLFNSDILDDEFVDRVFAEVDEIFNEKDEDNPDAKLWTNKDTLLNDTLDDEFVERVFAEVDEIFNEVDDNPDIFFDTSLDKKELTIKTNRPESDFKVLTYKKIDYYIPRIVNSFPIAVFDDIKQVGVIYQNDINNIQFIVNKNV